MKRILLGLLTICMLSYQAKASDVDFFLDLFRFQTVQATETYAEIFIAVNGTSVTYKALPSGAFQAQVNVSIHLRRIEDKDSVDIFVDTYNLESGLLSDTSLTTRKHYFLNIHRIGLEPGRYYIEATLYDALKNKSRKIMASNEFLIKPPTRESCEFSDLVFVETMRLDRSEKAKEHLLYKRGYIQKPLITNDAFINADSLFFYVELYNADKLIAEPTFYIRARIKQGDKILYAYETTPPRKTKRPFNLYFDKIAIRDLPSQTYYLQIDVLTEQNQIVKSMSKKFHVYNSRVGPDFEDYVVASKESDIFAKYSEEELDYYLSTLIHESTEQEISFRKALETYEQKKNYLYSFWEKRAGSEQTVASKWNWHLSALQYTNQQFKSAFRKGWQTDRGRVFLKYGIPSDIERFPSSSTTVPYEIWRYDRLINQTNVIFVFFDPDLTTEEYPLLHSSKYGEINNPGWKRQLVARGHVPNTFDYENNSPDIRGAEFDRN